MTEPLGMGSMEVPGRPRAAHPVPVTRHAAEHYWPMGTPVTPNALSVVAEYLIHGNYAEAAACLGIALQTAKNHGEQAMCRTGTTSIAQAAYRLGWVTIPEGLGHTESGA